MPCVATLPNVRAHPGGWVTLSFDPLGFETRRQTGAVGWLLGDIGCMTSVLLTAVFGGAAFYAYDAGLFIPAVVLGVLAAPWALVVLVRVLGEAMGEVFGFLMLAAMVLLSPLMVFPSVRRWVRARRHREAPIRPRPDARRVLTQAVSFATVQRDMDIVTVIVHTDGTPVSFTARGGAGMRLEQEFRQLLGARLR